MKKSESDTMSRQTCDLLFAVSKKYSPEVADSVVTHYGDPRSTGSWELEEMLDTLISMANEKD